MRVIGVTGGVGAGKSTVLGILEEDFQAYVIQ
ncbi:MAG: dephospho-CoA kinase, partial [Blautia massiliensis]